MFEGVYGVPDGVSYNSYLLKDEKTVLFDTVDRAVSDVFFDNLAYALDGRTLDYLIVQHMEPDHAATIPDLLARYPDVQIICSAMAQKMLDQFFPGTKFAVRTVRDGDRFETGRHKMHFLTAPMVHWPEVIMTYDDTDHILFSADAFGSFGALNGHLFADEVDFMRDGLDEARRYYTNIVGKYGDQVMTLAAKLVPLDLATVCPLHGYVWRSGFSEFFEKYGKWATYTPEVRGVMIAYASVYGNTESAANRLACELAERGVSVKMYDTSVTPVSYILADAFRYSHLVFASTTYNAGVFVTMENLLHDIAAHQLRNRRVALIENGSWAPTSGGLMAEILRPLQGVEFVSDCITLRSAAKPAQEEQLVALAEQLASEIVPKATAIDESTVKASTGIRNEAFFKFSYGLFLLSARANGRDNGCIINTAIQLTEDPKRVLIAVNKANLTCNMIRESGVFNLSALAESTPFSVFQSFGFRSGRNVNKFDDVEDVRSANGLRILPEHASAFFSCKVIDQTDYGTHTLFVAEVTEASVLSDEAPATYAYYFEHIKPRPKPASETKKGFVCKICGYVYEGDTLPDDFICPLCKHGVDAFAPAVAPEQAKKKGFVCKICGYIYDGDTLPDDFICPLCKHGAADFEPIS
jgi:flavorubredoxin/flavin reductase (DIM6/NTAB) family NADH-FMN oxidoreductase RutF